MLIIILRHKFDNVIYARQMSSYLIYASESVTTATPASAVFVDDDAADAVDDNWRLRWELQAKNCLQI